MKPIETVYNGYRFRSRLEARWAVFFDAVGLKYRYEPEGYELSDGTKYLPDFEIYGVVGRGRGYEPEKPLYVEVKGIWVKEDIHKCKQFAEDGNKLYCVGDIPQNENDAIRAWKESDMMLYSASMIDGDSYPIFWCKDWSGNVALYGADNLPGWYPWEMYCYELVYPALKKARQARFEHGEFPI
jgi:hypothetical protein